MLKHIRFGLLMQPDEKLVLDRLAEREGGLSAAAMVRRLIRKEGERQGIWVGEPKQGDSDADRGVAHNHGAYKSSTACGT